MMSFCILHWSQVMMVMKRSLRFLYDVSHNIKCIWFENVLWFLFFLTKNIFLFLKTVWSMDIFYIYSLECPDLRFVTSSFWKQQQQNKASKRFKKSLSWQLWNTHPWIHMTMSTLIKLYHYFFTASKSTPEKNKNTKTDTLWHKCGTNGPQYSRVELQP